MTLLRCGLVMAIAVSAIAPALAAGSGASTTSPGSSARSLTPPASNGNMVDAATAFEHVERLRNYLWNRWQNEGDFRSQAKRFDLLRKYGVNDGDGAVVRGGTNIWPGQDGGIIADFYGRNAVPLDHSLVNLVIAGHPAFLPKAALDNLDNRMQQLEQVEPKIQALADRARDLGAQIVAIEVKQRPALDRQRILTNTFTQGMYACKMCVGLQLANTSSEKMLLAHSGDAAMPGLLAQRAELQRKEEAIRAEFRAINTQFMVEVGKQGAGQSTVNLPDLPQNEVPRNGVPD